MALWGGIALEPPQFAMAILTALRVFQVLGVARVSCFGADVPGRHTERSIVDGATFQKLQASNPNLRLQGPDPKSAGSPAAVATVAPLVVFSGFSISAGAQNALWSTRTLQCGSYRFAKFMSIPVIIGKLASF